MSDDAFYREHPLPLRNSFVTMEVQGRRNGKATKSAEFVRDLQRLAAEKVEHDRQMAEYERTRAAMFGEPSRACSPNRHVWTHERSDICAVCGGIRPPIIVAPQRGVAEAFIADHMDLNRWVKKPDIVVTPIYLRGTHHRHIIVIDIPALRYSPDMRHALSICSHTITITEVYEHPDIQRARRERENALRVKF